jgi:hypothetical protein
MVHTTKLIATIRETEKELTRLPVAAAAKPVVNAAKNTCNPMAILSSQPVTWAKNSHRFRKRTIIIKYNKGGTLKFGFFLFFFCSRNGRR